MTTKPYVSSASDYAGMAAGPWTFYYGYEWGYMRGQVSRDDDEPEVWGFTASRDGTVVLSLSADEMSDRLGERLDQGDTTRMLLLGIGLALQLAVHAP